MLAINRLSSGLLANLNERILYEMSLELLLILLDELCDFFLWIFFLHLSVLSRLIFALNSSSHLSFFGKLTDDGNVNTHGDIDAFSDLEVIYASPLFIIRIIVRIFIRWLSILHFWVSCHLWSSFVVAHIQVSITIVVIGVYRCSDFSNLGCSFVNIILASFSILDLSAGSLNIIDKLMMIFVSASQYCYESNTRDKLVEYASDDHGILCRIFEAEYMWKNKNAKFFCRFLCVERQESDHNF